MRTSFRPPSKTGRERPINPAVYPACGTTRGTRERLFLLTCRRFCRRYGAALDRGSLCGSGSRKGGGIRLRRVVPILSPCASSVAALTSTHSCSAASSQRSSPSPSPATFTPSTPADTASPSPSSAGATSPTTIFTASPAKPIAADPHSINALSASRMILRDGAASYVNDKVGNRRFKTRWPFE